MAVRVSWTAPVGAYAAFLMGDRDYRSAVVWLVIILVHEAGHALLARRYGRGVTAISIHGLGGECEWIPGDHPWAREIVAWGGVLAQLALFASVLVVDAWWPLPAVMGWPAFYMLTAYNLFIALFNLTPIGNLDGRNAWPLLAVLSPSRLHARWRGRASFRRRKATAKRPPRPRG
jgi:membrane-associated protease RseP (regulator of RpoE activity)